MPRITKGNARQNLSDAILRFNKVTGEYVGVVYSWKGKLSVLGNESFKNFISEDRETIWQTLALGQPSSDIPDIESEMMDLLKEDIKSHNVYTLREIVTWATRKTTNKPRNFWGLSQHQPSFWPKEIPFIKKSKNLDKATLLPIVQSIQNSFHPEPSKPVAYRDRSPIHLVSPDDSLDIEHEDEQSINQTLHSTPKSFSSSQEIFQEDSHIFCPSSPLNQNNSIPTSPIIDLTLHPDHSYSPEPIFNSPSESLTNLSGAIPLTPLKVQFIKILSDNVRDKCLRELSDPNTFLTDVTINAFGVLVKNTYPKISGLQDTILSENRQFIKALQPSFQLHHDGGLHWVCSKIDEQGIISVYDSKFNQHSSEQLDIQLSLLYGTQSKSLKVVVQPIQQQRGVSDCGVFAISVCIALANDVDPCELRWRQANMRNHLRKCIESERLSTPPTVPSRLGKKIQTNLKHEYVIKLWCLCRLPEFAFRNMIMCPECKQWFHKPCVGLEDVTQKVLLFTCKECKNKRQVIPKDN